MDKQSEIATWFDKTYQKHGELYLRPKQAYYIFLHLLNAKKEEKLLSILIIEFFFINY